MVRTFDEAGFPHTGDQERGLEKSAFSRMSGSWLVSGHGGPEKKKKDQDTKHHDRTASTGPSAMMGARNPALEARRIMPLTFHGECIMV